MVKALGVRAWRFWQIRNYFFYNGKGEMAENIPFANVDFSAI